MVRNGLKLFLSFMMAASCLQAQETVQRMAAAAPAVDAARGRVAEAMAKGDSATAEKILGSIANAPGPNAVAFPAGNTTYEEIRSCGFYPQESRLECIVDIKQPLGYGGPVGAFGSYEFVSFYVDWQGNGFQASDYAGAGIVHVTDGSAGTSFAVYRDIDPPTGPRPYCVCTRASTGAFELAMTCTMVGAVGPESAPSASRSIVRYSTTDSGSSAARRALAWPRVSPDR